MLGETEALGYEIAAHQSMCADVRLFSRRISSCSCHLGTKLIPLTQLARFLRSHFAQALP